MSGSLSGEHNMNALKGKRVLVTRPNHQADSFVSELTATGALPVIAPAIKVFSLMDDFKAQETLDKLDTFDWVIFTSANGVEFFTQALADRSELDKLARCKLACIGPKTGLALEKKVRKPDAIPEEFISHAIVDTLGSVQGQNILLARAVKASKILGQDLLERGASVHELDVYDIEENIDPVMIQALTNLKAPDYLTFTSSSTVHSMARIFQIAKLDWLKTVPAVCIGPVTAKTLKEYQVEPFAVAEIYTIEGMISAIQKKAQN